jgi:hypothetical protein
VHRVDLSHHVFVLEHLFGSMNRRVLANLHDDDRDLVRLVLKTCLTKKKLKKWMDARKVDLLKVFYFYLPFLNSITIYF